ncbi:MAG: potassium channel protein [Solirubrobacterales bacterium]|nr:potassium channel protein [Solirubrobacterales bacterium]
MPAFLQVARVFEFVNKRKAITLLIFVAFILVAGATAFSLSEHQDFGSSVYWVFTTATTVGYGDVTPKTAVGRIVANVVMLTTIPSVAAVFAIWTGSTIINNTRRLLGMDSNPPNDAYTAVYGTHPVVPRVIDELVRSGEPVVLVAGERPAGLTEAVHFIAGDPTDEAVIKHTDLARANRVLIACEDDSDTLVIAVAIASAKHPMDTYALTQSPRVARALKELGIDHTLSADELVGHTLAKSLETPHAGGLLLQLVDTDNYRLVQTPVADGLVAKPLSAIRAEHRGKLVLGVARGEDVDLGLSDDPTLASGDTLIVLEPTAAA